MTVRTNTLSIDTQGSSQMLDLTQDARDAIERSGCTSGLVTIFVAHTTAAVTISEFEPGLIEDLPQTFDQLVPADHSYRHNVVNHDDNAHSHIRTSLLGPSISVPFDQESLMLGVWQHIVLIDFDTHPRRRTVIIQVIGE